MWPRERGKCICYAQSTDWIIHEFCCANHEIKLCANNPWISLCKLRIRIYEISRQSRLQYASMHNTTYITSSLHVAIIPPWSAQLLVLHRDVTSFAAGTASMHVVNAEALAETHTLRAATR